MSCMCVNEPPQCEHSAVFVRSAELSPADLLLCASRHFDSPMRSLYRIPPMPSRSRDSFFTRQPSAIQHSRRECRSSSRLSGRGCIKCEFTLSPLQPNLISSPPNPAAKIREPPRSPLPFLHSRPAAECTRALE